MQISVFREILDESIGGEKIFGGEIDFIDKLYSESIQVPKTGSSGTGSINGTGVTIGDTEYLASIRAESIIASNGGSGSSIIAKNATYETFKVAITSNHARLEMRNGNDGNQTHFFHPVFFNYIIPGTIIGGSSILNAAYKLQVDGDIWGRDAYFDDVGGGLTLSDWYADYSVLDGQVATNTATLSGIPSNLNLLTNAEVTQLANINSSIIDSTQWARLAAMQDVSIGAAVNFSVVSSLALYSSAALTIVSSGETTIDGGSGNGVIIGGMFGFLPNGTIDYDTPTSGVKFYSHLTNGIAIQKPNFTGGVRVDGAGGTHINEFPGGASGIGLAMHGEGATQGSFVLFCVADGLRLVSDTNADLIYCNNGTTGWQVDSAGVMSVSGNMMVNSTDTGSLKIGSTNGSQIKFIKKLDFNVDFGTVNDLQQKLITKSFPGAKTGDTVIINVDRFAGFFAGNNGSLNFEACIETDNQVNFYAINSDTGFTAFTVDVNIKCTVISYG